jgi:6-phosphogluconolactonase
MVFSAVAEDAVQVSVRVFPDREALSWAVARFFADRAPKIGEPTKVGAPSFCVALSGGSTPQRAYELLSSKGQIDWSRVHLFLGDERYVVPSSPLSNERMVLEALVGSVDIPTENVHPIYSPDGLKESADRYEELLRSFFTGDSTFDLALQGLGEDGHTASLFPGFHAEPGRWVVAVPDGHSVTAAGLDHMESGAPGRITLTLDCLAAAREVVFVVSGESKAEILRDVLAGNQRYPAAVLADRARDVNWWVDAAAASLM